MPGAATDLSHWADLADLAALSTFCRAHPRLFVLTGAGVSTESGIPDYRDAEGGWKRAQPMTFQRFMGEPLARQRYWARSLVGWRTMGAAQPGPAHRALAALQAAGRIVQLVTQNVDGLHQAAGHPGVIDLHGRIDTVVCMACGQRLPRADFQAELAHRNPHWATLDAVAAPDGDADLPGLDFAAFAVPDCPHCGAGPLKPDVVFFGEAVPKDRVANAFAALAASDAVLVCGSSLMVYSGYRFVAAAVAAGQPVAAVNLGRTRADAHLALKVPAACGSVLPQLVARLAAQA